MKFKTWVKNTYKEEELRTSKKQHKEEQNFFTNRNQTHTQNTHTHNLFLNWYVKESRRDPFIGENEQFFFKLLASQTGETGRSASLEACRHYV